MLAVHPPATVVARAWVLALVVAGALTPGCRLNNLSTPAGAAVFAGTAAAASALHRQLTGDCYSACSAGWYCDRSTGLCERGGKRDETIPHQFTPSIVTTVGAPFVANGPQ